MILGSEALSLFLVHLAIFLSLAGVIGVWVLYIIDPKRPRSWLLWTLAITSTFIWACCTYLGWIATIRIKVGLGGVPPWTGGITTTAVILMALSITFLLVQFWRHRND